MGDTGALVFELCLGAMTFGGHAGQWHVIAGLDQRGVDAIVHRTLDATAPSRDASSSAR